MRNECLFVCSNSDQKKKITVFNISLVSKDACDLNDWWWQRLTFAAGCCCCLSHFFASFSKCPKGRRCNKKDGGKDVSFYFLFSRKKEYSLIKYDGWLDGWLAWWKKNRKRIWIFFLLLFWGWAKKTKKNISNSKREFLLLLFNLEKKNVDGGGGGEENEWISKVFYDKWKKQKRKLFSNNKMAKFLFESKKQNDETNIERLENENENCLTKLKPKQNQTKWNKQIKSNIFGTPVVKSCNNKKNSLFLFSLLSNS